MRHSIRQREDRDRLPVRTLTTEDRIVAVIFGGGIESPVIVFEGFTSLDNTFGQPIDDVLMLGGIFVLILGLGLGIAGFGFGLAHMPGRIVDKAEESVNKEEESADAWNPFFGRIGLEATYDGVEGLRAHHIDPIVEREDAAHHHREEGTEHIFWWFGGSAHI
ncbi:MAG: hypothetical protein HYY30_11805 [Chloroflexi bacterium]|nr:hypothetical protein [Chloroflexota bacterium]